MEKLRECPFCGSNKSLVPHGAHMRRGGKIIRRMIICCQNCRTSGPKEPSKDLAIVSWNRRTPPPTHVLVPVEPTEEMKLAGIAECRKAHIYPGASNRIYRAMLSAAKDAAPPTIEAKMGAKEAGDATAPSSAPPATPDTSSCG